MPSFYWGVPLPIEHSLTDCKSRNTVTIGLYGEPGVVVNNTGAVSLGGTSGILSGTAQTGNVVTGAAAANVTKTASNTTSETTLVPTVSGSMTIPANGLVVGATYRLHATGTINNTSTPTLEIRAYIGSAVVGDTGAVNTVSLSGNNEWTVDENFTCQSTGSSGTVYAQGEFDYFSAATTKNFEPMANSSATTVNTTTTELVKITGQWGTAASGDSIICTNLTLERVY